MLKKIKKKHIVYSSVASEPISIKPIDLKFDFVNPLHGFVVPEAVWRATIFTGSKFRQHQPTGMHCVCVNVKVFFFDLDL